jgi:quercetin dioxygenase-like cupin family protein
MLRKVLRLVLSGVIAVSSVLVTLAVEHASAQSSGEPALAMTADDPSLQWGPCPEFLPAGCQIAVLHGNPAEPNTDLFFRLPARSVFALHRHTSPERMLLVAGELHVTFEGQPMAVLKPGSYAYGPANRPHSGSCVSAVPCVLFIAFEAPVDAVPISN